MTLTSNSISIVGNFFTCDQTYFDGSNIEVEQEH